MIRIVTDSTADIPQAMRDALGIVTVPLTVRFGDETLLDGVELDADGFWSRAIDRLPETAAPAAGAFIDAFERLAGEGATGVVTVTLSSRLSGTNQAAAIAAGHIGIPVRVVDSGTVSMPFGFAALAAAERAAAGADLDTVAATATEVAASMDLLCVLDTLEHLHRGGRIGRAQALVGGMLDIKPLITVEDGVVVPAGRVRTRSKARAAIVDRAEAVARAGFGADRVAVLHARCDDLDEVVTEVRRRVGDGVVVAELGPVVATHTGPGALAIVHPKV